MEKFKQLLFSENGIKIVNMLFFLAFLAHNLVFLVVAYLVWILCNLVRRTEKGRLRRRGWGLRWEKAQKGGKGTNLRGFFED